MHNMEQSSAETELKIASEWERERVEITSRLEWIARANCEVNPSGTKCAVCFTTAQAYETVASLVCLTCLCVRQLIHPIDMWLWRLHTFLFHFNILIVSRINLSVSVWMLLVSSLFVSLISLQHCYRLHEFLLFVCDVLAEIRALWLSVGVVVGITFALIISMQWDV